MPEFKLVHITFFGCYNQCKVTGIKRNNSQTKLRVAQKGIFSEMLFLSKSNLLANTAKICWRYLQIRCQFFKCDVLQYIRATP